MIPKRFKNGSSWVTPATAAKRMAQWKMCERCGGKFYRKGNQIPSTWKKQKYCSRICARALRVPMTIERFISNVFPDPASGCWLWGGHADSKGYGTAWRDRAHVKAHRLSWELHNGQIPDGLCVCHKCDTPACVNPDHLFLATQRENIADMDKKGRRVSRRGSAHGCSILLEKDVRKIRKDTRPISKIAADYGVSPSTVSAIRSGQNWGWLD